jgi:hypothetical protein
LIGNQQQLRHNHDQQDREVAVAAEEEVHTLQLFMCGRSEFRGLRPRPYLTAYSIAILIRSQLYGAT